MATNLCHFVFLRKSDNVNPLDILSFNEKQQYRNRPSLVGEINAVHVA